MEMTMNQYAKKAREFAVYNKDMGAYYTVLGLCGESGEVADKLKKVYRDKNGVLENEDIKQIAFELGDVLWYLTNTAADLGLTLEQIAELNLGKLYKRRQTNTIHGEGDNR